MSMMFLEFGPTTIQPGQTIPIVASSQRAFRPMKLIVADIPRPWWRRLLTSIPFVRRFVADARTAFQIVNIKVGGVAQMKVIDPSGADSANGVPAEVFMPGVLDQDTVAHPGALSLDAASPGQSIEISVSNVSRHPCEFRAAMVGIGAV